MSRVILIEDRRYFKDTEFKRQVDDLLSDAYLEDLIEIMDDLDEMEANYRVYEFVNFVNLVQSGWRRGPFVKLFPVK